jgi:hypothetical protein
LFVFVDQVVKGFGHNQILRAQKLTFLIARLLRKSQGGLVQKVSVVDSLFDVHFFPFFGFGGLKPVGGRAPTAMKYSSAVSFFLGETATLKGLPVRY